MRMAESKGLSERWNAYQPSKGVWFWSVAGAAVATMVLGFTVGGWTTGGTAEEMAEKAATSARTELAAALCVNRFAAAEGAAQQLALLKEARSWERGKFITNGGWALLPERIEPVRSAADLCASKLA